MDYKNYIDNYTLDELDLEKVKKIIEEGIEKKCLDYRYVKKSTEISKNQFYYALYLYLIDSRYLNKKEPDENILIKITKIDLFKDSKLPFDERRELPIFVIQYINKNFGISFRDQILDLSSTEQGHDYFQIQHAFSKAIPFMKISNDDLYQTLYHFSEQSSRDMTVGEVYNAVQYFCSNNQEQGWELIELIKTKKDSRFLFNALIGLSAVKFDDTLLYTNELYNNNYKRDAVLVLGYLNYKSIKQLNETINKFEDTITKESDNATLSATAKSIANLAYHPLVEKSKQVEKIFDLVEKILSKKIPEIQFNILQGLQWRKEKKYLNYKKKLLIYYYDIKLENKGIIQDLSFFLHDLNDPRIILNFIKEWIINHESVNELDYFNYALNDSYRFNPKQFISKYVKLLIHPKSKIRNAIKLIFEIVKLNENNRNIWIEELLSLSFQEQLNLFKSLNDYSIDIIDRLQTAALLLKTHNKELYRFLIQEFVWLIHDFGAKIKDIIISVIDDKNSMENEFKDAFMKYYSEITNFWKEKSQIFEIDPTLNQTKIMNKYNEIYYKKENEIINGFRTYKTPLLNMITKIQIGRGRSFKIGNNSEPGYMSKIEHSFILPRTLFIFPEYFNFNWNKSRNDDWEN